MLVLDFDGTVTDAEQEGLPFREGYLDDLAVLTGRGAAEIRAMASRFAAEIAADPDRHGWEHEGRVVAPSTVDPYLRIMPVAHKILDECRLLAEPEARSREMEELFGRNYTKTAIAFRDGARELFLGMEAACVYVVTNSHTEPVQAKIRGLGPGGELDWLLGRVRGRARKYVVDDSFTRVPEALHLPGLSRPVLLRRRVYHDLLRGLLDREGQDFGDLLVVGDIFELDLALPLALGARVGLVANQFTPAYEQGFVAGHPRGHVIEHLSEIPALLG